MKPTKQNDRLKQMKISFFFTTMLVYFCFFILCFFLMDLFFTVFQVHPIIYAICSVALLIVDIKVTQIIMDKHLLNKWLR